MAEAKLAAVRNYMDRGASGFASLLLPSGEGVFVSLAASGLRVHRAHLGGRLPGRTLHKAAAPAVRQMVTVFVRDIARLPKLPESAAMDSFLVIAAQAIGDPGIYGRTAKDEDGEPLTDLAAITRAVLAEPDAASLVRRLSRAAATP